MAGMESTPEDAFMQLLLRLGFTQAAIQFLVDQGIDNASSFATHPFNQLTTTYNTLSQAIKNENANRSRSSKTTEGDGGDILASDVECIVMPLHAWQKLRAFRAWLDYRSRRGQTPDSDAFTNEMIQPWVERSNFISGLSAGAKPDGEAPKTPLNDFLRWDQFKESFNLYVSTRRSTTGAVPLNYVIRDHTEVTDEHFGMTYPDIDYELVNTACRVYALLRPLIGPSLEYLVRPSAKYHDGRQAWLALVAQAEGQHARLARSTAASTSLNAAKYTGTSQRYTFDEYVRTHSTAHNDLSLYGEELSEEAKKRQFLEGITDSYLESVKMMYYASPEKFPTFESLQQYFKTLLISLGAAKGVAPAGNRRVSQATSNTRGRGGGGRKGGGGGGGGGGNGRGGGGGRPRPPASGRKTNQKYKHLPREEWLALTD